MASGEKNRLARPGETATLPASTPAIRAGLSIQRERRELHTARVETEGAAISSRTPRATSTEDFSKQNPEPGQNILALEGVLLPVRARRSPGTVHGRGPCLGDDDPDEPGPGVEVIANLLVAPDGIFGPRRPSPAGFGLRPKA